MFGAALLAGLILWLATLPREKEVTMPAPAVPTVVPAPAVPAETPPSPPATVMPSSHPRKPDLPGGASRPEGKNLGNPLAPASFPTGPEPRTVETADPDVIRDLDQVSLMLRGYRTLTGENPVGTNAEIMKALMGGNPKGAALGPPEGMEMSADGELLDRWGTPYFFHQLSKDVMEIHSAGPDRVRGTEDDVLYK